MPQTPQQNASNSPANVGEQFDGNWTISQDTQVASPSIIQNGEGSDLNPTTTTNKAGIRLSKPGYYMFPTLDELDDLIDDNGQCVVQDFVIGRQVGFLSVILPILFELPKFRLVIFFLNFSPMVTFSSLD